MVYAERPAPVAGAVLWQRSCDQGPERAAIMPDGCMDLLWDGRRLFVAGPDTTARWHVSPAGATYAAVRFSGGLGPALLGVPADELRDRATNLDELWPAREVAGLTERVAANPPIALVAWVTEQAARRDPDPFGLRVLAMSKAGTPVTEMAERPGVTARQLHRRCLPVFGYGPKRLARVMRFGRALEAIRRGVPLADASVDCGYADQAHLSREVRALAGTTPTGLLGAPYG